MPDFTIPEARARRPAAELAVRLLTAAVLPPLVVLAAVWIIPVALVGRRGYADELLSGASRLLNALTGGPATATTSAFAHELAKEGKPTGAARVRWIDRFNLHPGHCEAAWRDPRNRGHLPPPAEPRA